MASSHTTIDRTPRQHDDFLPSRLIPGKSISAAPRRKAVSATIGASWTWQNPEKDKRFRVSSWSSAAERFLLPEAIRHPEFLSYAVPDFLLIAAGLTSILVVRGFVWRAIGACREHAIVTLSSMLVLAFLYATLFILFAHSERLYHQETVERPEGERTLLAKVLVGSAVIFSAFLAASGSYGPSVAILAAAPVNFLLLFAQRSYFRPRSLCNGCDSRNVLIVGAGSRGRRLASYLKNSLARKRIVRGFLDDREALNGEILGRISDLAQVARREFADEIILTLPIHTEAAQQAIWQARLNRLDIKLVPDLLGFDPTRVALERIGGVPILTLCEEPFPAMGLRLKRALDVVLSAICLILMSPVMTAIAVAIKLDSPGPVVYRAPRLGLKGHRFLCYKFRTMVADADELKDRLRQLNERTGPMFKISNDPRLTRVGRVLRRYSLDELPQLWNVLRGEMSLVGPRPHPLDDFARYKLEDLQRLEVTPGITGLWQITARSDPSFERSMALDRQYISEWSLRTDIRILWKTLGVVFQGQGL
jgi:exopolysaccharide biosynthesis polyprenyl glycosylphosphotransferase